MKETFFFDRHFDKGWGWYWRHFHATSGGLLGEVAPTYFDHEPSLRRLHGHNPYLKVIVSLRDPIERAYSLYCHHFAKGRVRGTFRDAIDQLPRILESGRYSAIGPRWIDTFGADRVFLLLYQCVAGRPRELLGEVASFLDLEPIEWGNVHQPVGRRTVPRSLLLSGIAARAATWLRDRGAHGVVNAAKALGIKQFVFSGGRRGPEALRPHDRDLLERYYRDDAAWIAKVSRSGPASQVLSA